MKRKLSFVMAIILLVSIGVNSLAIASVNQGSDTTTISDRRPRDCRYERCD